MSAQITQKSRDDHASIARYAADIDSEFASRLAFMLECMLVDSHGHWNEAARLLDEYKAAWERINPQPPLFMGEPMPPERLDRLRAGMAARGIEGASRTTYMSVCPQCGDKRCARARDHDQPCSAPSAAAGKEPS